MAGRFDRLNFSDVFSVASPRAQEYMGGIMGDETGGEMKGRGSAVAAIIEALRNGQEYDFAGQFDVGTPEGMKDFMGTMHATSRLVGPDERSMLVEQAKKSMMMQPSMAGEMNRPLRQHGMGEMLRKSVELGGAPLANPAMAGQVSPLISPEGAMPPDPGVGPMGGGGGAVDDMWRALMEKTELALQANQISEAQARATGWTPDWRSQAGPSPLGGGGIGQAPPGTIR